MDFEPETTRAHGSSPTESLDLTGLPASVVNEIRELVATLRGNMGQPSRPAALSGEEPYEAWTQRLQLWVESHPARPIAIDDSRESVYSDRGE